MIQTILETILVAHSNDVEDSPRNDGFQAAVTAVAKDRVDASFNGLDNTDLIEFCWLLVLRYRIVSSTSNIHHFLETISKIERNLPIWRLITQI
ncbi:uncharacterized protein PHALS_02169 [Plasmopara halstedii]|uniref:Uncharacterized protein n=1 Tax=Plasmopara halstedii TaxID=4781 RepID=A0A0P1A723_PLAHL|nr:uncharacterized protein PHALS_02169 [Plasmopara halstedii]CEG36256.1 hypothetical protein PHALS_02169 [Plasmopara halstedii]|eukprot:XP_024572625.1 hypothetical protein PHALS_02169 [Plasmopara halstedii]